MPKHGTARHSGAMERTGREVVLDRNSPSTTTAPLTDQDRSSESEWDRMWKLPFAYPHEEGER
jgi:hypothetical protein